MPAVFPATRTRLALCAAVALVATACTSEPDTPQPAPAPPAAPPAAQPAFGVSVGVVLPAATEVDPSVLTAVESDVSRLGASLGPEVRQIRTVTPDDAVFAGDLAGLLADRGTDLVCVVGNRSLHGLRELAELHPDLRFCSTAAASEAGRDGDVELVEVRADELGHVVGVAARTAAGAGGVGLVLSGDELPRSAFRSGLMAGLEGAEVVELEGEDGAQEAVEAALADGIGVFVVDGGERSAEALEVAEGHAVVLAPSPLLGTARGRAALSWRVRWDLVLRRPVAGLLGWSDRGPASFGFAEGAFTVVARPAASAAVRRSVETAIEEITGDLRDPLEPAPDATPAEDDDGAEDGADEDAGPDGTGDDEEPGDGA